MKNIIRQTNPMGTKGTNQATILRVDGRTLNDNDKIPEAIERFRQEMFANSAKAVVLDLTGISEICSRGFNTVVGLHKKCIKEKRDFSVEIADQRLWDLFMSLKLDNKIEFKRMSL